MTTTTSSDPIVDVLGALDFRESLKCEGEGHPRGVSHHMPDQPGEYLMVSPCCRFGLVICRSRKAYLSGPTVAEIRCTKCHLKYPPDRWRFELIV